MNTYLIDILRILEEHSDESVEILAPTALRIRVRETVKKMWERYSLET